jgi:hypothetical protein
MRLWNDWLIDYLRFYLPLKNFSLIWRRHHCRWRAAKFRPMLGAQGLWAGRDLYCATPAVTQDLGFFGLIRRTAPFSRLLRHKRGCGGSILTRILTGIRKNRCFCCLIYTFTDLISSHRGRIRGRKSDALPTGNTYRKTNPYLGIQKFSTKWRRFE